MKSTFVQVQSTIAAGHRGGWDVNNLAIAEWVKKQKSGWCN